jgi:hypothetical protein
VLRALRQSRAKREGEWYEWTGQSVGNRAATLSEEAMETSGSITLGAAAEHIAVLASRGVQPLRPGQGDAVPQEVREQLPVMYDDDRASDFKSCNGRFRDDGVRRRTGPNRPEIWFNTTMAAGWATWRCRSRTRWRSHLQGASGGVPRASGRDRRVVANPHLFRDCTATTIAIAEPGQIGVERDLLGHASLHTTNAYYNQARSIEASRLYSTVLSAARTKATADLKL